MLGFPMLYCKGMRPMIFQLSGSSYRLPGSPASPFHSKVTIFSGVQQGGVA